MDSELSLVNNGDSLLIGDHGSTYIEYELKILNKIILLLSGYDTSPFFSCNLEDKHVYPLGIYPDVLETLSIVNTPHVSASAITSLLNEFAHFGSAIHLLNRLNDNLTEAYKNSKKKPVAPSLIVLMLEEPKIINGYEHDTPECYDWYWKDNFGGFCTALSVIFNDWRLIMFKIQEKYFKTVYNQNGEWVLYPNFIRNLDELTSPVFEMLETHKFVSDSKESRVLDLYVNMMPFLKLMESLTNLIELFLNYLKINDMDKADMPNAMLTLLIMKVRTSEMTNDKSMMKMWRFLLFYSFMDRKDYVLTLTTENMFSLFEESRGKAIQIADNIKSLDPKNSKKNLNLIFDNDLKRNLLRICNLDSQSIEFKLISYLNYKFKNFITLGMGITEYILKNKYNYNHYLYIFNSIALGRFGDNTFRTKSILKERKIKSLFDRICVDQLRVGSSLLSELNLEELNQMLAKIKIDYVGDKYVIGIVEKNSVCLFPDETMKMYSAIFNHILEFLRFREKLEALINECKWRTNKSSHNALPIFFILIHISNSLTTYFTLIIDHFWDNINKLNYGISIEEIKRKHLKYLTVVYTLLFVPGSSEIGSNTKSKSIPESLTKIFSISNKLTSLMVKDSNNSSETYKKLKSHFDDIVTSLETILIDGFVDYDNWDVFSDDKYRLSSNGCAKTAPHNILSVLKNLLSFNCTLV